VIRYCCQNRIYTTYLVNDGVTTQSLDIGLGRILCRLVIHGQIGMKQSLKVKRRRPGVIDQQGTGHFDAGDAYLVGEQAFGAVRFGLTDTPGIVVPHAVRHVRPIQGVLGPRGVGFVVGGFQFPLVETRKAVLRHGGFGRPGRTKDGEANGNPTPNRLAAIRDGFTAAKEIFPSIGRLVRNDRGTHGMNGRTGTRSRMLNRCQIRTRHG